MLPDIFSPLPFSPSFLSFLFFQLGLGSNGGSPFGGQYGQGGAGQGVNPQQLQNKAAPLTAVTSVPNLVSPPVHT